MTTSSAQGSTDWCQQESERDTPNGNEKSSDAATKAYPTPTALYDDLARDSNLFWDKLESFHKSFGTKFKVPTIGGRPLDLYRLFVEVTSRGGIEKVIVERKWKDVIVGFKFRETITSASFMVRRYYLSLLYHFEQAYYFRKQVPPSSTPDPANRSLVDSSTPFGEAGKTQQLGSVVPGTIDGKFDGGYIVTVNLGSEQVKGILYHVPISLSQSSNTVGVHGSRNRKKSRLALGDPSRPKSNKSGYNFFFAENYARLRPLFHGEERAISKRIGFLWNNLTEAERQVYQEKGLRDKERYKTELLEHKSSNN
ncbi:hypothetical protein HN51_009742 [Arachis hypogaea]|uniref:High mobility group B protein n=2 Tax=Arachis TaxID=3817 RepID=A0A445CXZ8_ARAHY|nr:high mobility group B protein 10 [Arachis duranensis]XP_025702400.1 high mobility group B protein 10 [Arachis hypogaea]XP_057759902.1 high mobility group B protein 10 [Arachis stenosperma]QHO44281.1 High mobility group B protein [Arachis hypogaea]RYR55853.1 hypothetical protein Ahy_A05g021707 isoform B [Arachis hypogaea]